MPINDPIARTSLHSEVTSRIRSFIVESRIQPGERVPEMEISKELGVSRTPIREALKVLASEGLVDLLPLRGAVVKAFSDKDASDMLEVMGLNTVTITAIKPTIAPTNAIGGKLSTPGCGSATAIQPTAAETSRSANSTMLALAVPLTVMSPG